MSIRVILLVASAICFIVNALVTTSRVNLDALGKGLFVLSFVVH